MERIVIIDHINHDLYIEDLTDSDLEQYDGEEEKWIEDNYAFKSPEEFSWDFILCSTYFPDRKSTGIDIKYENLSNDEEI